MNIVRASKYEPEFQIKIIKPLLSGKRENNWQKLPYCNGGVKTERAGFLCPLG